MESTTYLITGANRGIGRGLVAALLARPATTVIATVRDPEHETAKSLATLPVGAESCIVVMKLDPEKDGDDATTIAIQGLVQRHNITEIDVAISNAAMQTCWGSVKDTPMSQVRSHVEVNVLAPLALFQAVSPLLDKSKKISGPKFVSVTSPIGSIGAMEEIAFPTTPYGISKAALNWLTKKIHVENPGLIAFPISPGWVQTEMGDHAAGQFGLQQAPVTLDDSVRGLLRQIDYAERKETSGRFIAFDGKQFPW